MPPAERPLHEDILEPEVKKIHARKRKVLRFTHSTTKATMLMVAAAAAAFIIENTPALPYFTYLWQSTHLVFSVGEFEASMSLEHFINDFLMALFFLMVGLEIKYEMTAGQLTSPRRAILPILAAVGGAIAPALVYTAVNWGGEHAGGWGVPMANDIAFCLGILALLGSRVPRGLNAYLSTMTIADDIIAILVIAIFYTTDLNLPWLLAAGALTAVLFAFNRSHIYDLAPYVVVGLLLWGCFLFSGVHATLAGVILALTIPARSEVKLDRAGEWFGKRAEAVDERYDPDEPDIAQKAYLREVRRINKVSRMTIPPVTRLEDKLHTFVYYIVLPLFAFSNAAVLIVGSDPVAVVTSPVAIGVFFGLLVGKPVGIFVATWLTVKTGLSDLPEGSTWGNIAGVAILGGVGFTMAIFITNLSFADPAIIAVAKASIMAASVVAGILGFFVLRATLGDGDEDDA